MIESTDLPVGDWADAVVFTPGGGRIGDLAGGALDSKLADVAGRWGTGRLVDVEVAEIDALIAGLPSVGSGRFMIVPADQFPGELWDVVARRDPVCIVCDVSGDEVTDITVYTEATVAEAGEEAKRIFDSGVSGSALGGDRVVSVFWAIPELVIVGDSPVAEALSGLAERLGWKARITADAASASGLMATLSPMDKVVVASHDLELAGGALMAALSSDAGYIGAVGARRMQENRADWLAYRGVTDLSRIHGPAGLDIGASTPGEIAVSILAEAIADAAERPATE